MAGAIRDFQDLDVWNVARELRTAIYDVASEGKRLDALTQRVGQLLNGYVRSTLALKAG